jgi:hypothetical protein
MLVSNAGSNLSLCLVSRIPPEQAANLHLEHSHNSLSENSLAHFGFTFGSIGKYDGYFYDTETVFPSKKLHFDLKGIPYKSYRIQMNGFKHRAMVTLETRCGIIDW